MKEVPLNDIQRLTELIAAHGVYALTVLVIFYLQFWAKKNLDTASSRDHDYFRRCHASTWVATWVMMVISTLVWIYATFVYKPTSPFIHGSVMDLTDQPLTPTKAEDPAELAEQIAPASRDVQLYESKQPHEGTGTYDVDWVIVPREFAPTTIAFTFQHHYSLWKPQNSAFSHLPSSTRSMLESDTVRRTFTIDLKALNHPLNTSLQIGYERDAGDPVRKVGKLYVRRDGTKIPIAWEDDKAAAATPATHAGVLLRNWQAFFPRLNAAEAAQQSAQVFDANGEYDAHTGRLLRERLASTDLKTQLAATAALVRAGQGSFRFISESLSTKETGYNRDLLVAVLARSLDELERAGTHAPTDLNLQMALALASYQDARTAARFFDRAGNAPIEGTDALFTRGYIYEQTGQYDKAIRDLDRYVRTAKTAPAKALAQTYIALAYEKQNNVPAAIDRYRAAILTDPTLAMAYNNLAYVYAERGENLVEALKLSNRALELNKDQEDVGLYKDTKGWILFRSGQYREALAILKEAAAAAPNEVEIRQHLEQVQRRRQMSEKS
jgi:tetratricopeptide (TPR) repeat protein